MIHHYLILLIIVSVVDSYISTVHRVTLPSLGSLSRNDDAQSPLVAATSSSFPRSAQLDSKRKRNILLSGFINSVSLSCGIILSSPSVSAADGSNVELPASTQSAPTVALPTKPIDLGQYKVPYEHENYIFGDYMGPKATIIFNMKIDDPQTVTQFPSLAELSKKYSSKGLNVIAFPTEQGWFEPDDDETCRLKALTYYGFGGIPSAVVFDKVDVLGPSAHPLFNALTKAIPTPNGYGRITLNYEKFLIDSKGQPVRRYPRKFNPYDMEADLLAVLNGDPLPPETPQFIKAWREAKREVVKSEYSFRYNYNYYDAPDSMYKYDIEKDKL